MSGMLIGLCVGMVVVVVLIVIVLALLVKRSPASTMDSIRSLLVGSERSQADTLRVEAKGIREELQLALSATRKETTESLDRLRTGSVESQQILQSHVQGRLDVFSGTLGSSVEALTKATQESSKELVGTLQTQMDALQRTTRDAADRQGATTTELKEKVTDAVTRGLKEIQEKNEQKLEQVRVTVDEKLQKTLDERLANSFEMVTKQLLLVQTGLTEMQNLAQDVGGLKKALTNVRVRGMLGEAQLAALLEQFLTSDQYAQNVAVRPRSSERVEFAVRLPGAEEGGQVWLPIDSKFAIEDYQRMQDAYEAADKDGFEQAGKAFEARVYAHAVTIASKYIDVPNTTDFALMFLPFESLFAEAIRRPGLFHDIQLKHKVTIVGPTTLAAFLNSLQVGFKTLAISRQSSEVWNVLGAVKTEFQKFGDAIASVERNHNTASDNLSKVSTRARQMEKKLGKVASLPAAEAVKLLPEGDEELA